MRTPTAQELRNSGRYKKLTITQVEKRIRKTGKFEGFFLQHDSVFYLNTDAFIFNVTINDKIKLLHRQQDQFGRGKQVTYWEEVRGSEHGEEQKAM